ncbi:MAG: hypothetical protein ACLQVG_25600 [Terriglobia bacterium]
MRHPRVLGMQLAVAAILTWASLGCQNPAQTLAQRPTQIAAGGSHQEQVMDPAYHMTAFTVEVPSNWKFAGMILRPGGCHPPPYPAAGLSFTERSPDGVTEAVVLPGVSWSWTSNGSNALGPKCPSNTDINTAAGLLLNIAVPNIHPDAKKVTLVPLPPKLKEQVDQINQQNAARAQRGFRQYLDNAIVRVEYEQNGHAMEETEFTAIDCAETQMMGMPMGPGRPWSKGFTRRTCNSRGTFIHRAPMGQLTTAFKNTKPPQINPEWDQRVIQDMKRAFQQMQAASDAAFKQNMANFKAEGDARLERGRVFQQNLQNSTDRAMAADRSRQAAIDNSAHQTALYSLDQQEFRNPSTGEIVRASNQYSHQWMSSDGSTLIQTNDHTLNPNGQVYPVSQSWTELVPK